MEGADVLVFGESRRDAFRVSLSRSESSWQSRPLTLGLLLLLPYSLQTSHSTS
jgi:hypothetical protein